MRSVAEILAHRERRRRALVTALWLLVRRLAAMGAVRVILFGSLARGATGPWSDLDLLVVMPDVRSGREWGRKIYADLDRMIACDIVAYSRGEWERELLHSRFLRHVERDGRLLYMAEDTRERAMRWLIQAQDEFQDADELRKRGRYYLALFLFQQSAEKALKAYLYNVTASQEVFFTHSIYELLQRAAEIEPEMGTLERASRLDQYYIPTRYPNGLPGGVPSRYYNDPAEAEEAMKLAEMVLEAVRAKLG